MRSPSTISFARFVTIARRLLTNRRGNVLMIMGFALLPLTFATGMVIDYSRAARLQTKLNAAADAATLSTTTKPMMDQSLQAACNTARRTFLNALEQSNAGLQFDRNAGPTISITESYASASNVTYACPKSMVTVPSSFSLPTIRTVTLTYAGLSTNAFGSVLNQTTIAIGGTATARSSTGAFYQIAFIVDVSNSMGIGGTLADITSLAGDSTIACAFACHDPNGTMGISSSSWCDGKPLDTPCRSNRNYCPSGTTCTTRNPSKTYSDRRSLATLYGYKLKIDYVNDAVNSFVDALQSKMPSGANKYAVSIDGFGTAYASIQAATTDWTVLKSGASKIDLEVAARSPPGYPNQGWTYTSVGLQSLRKGLTNVGDGSSPTSRATYVIFISDGVEDTFDTTNALGQFNRLTSYAYAQECQAIKSAGMTVFSIETAYPQIKNDNQYVQLVEKLPGRNGGKPIADVMRDCASSPNRYFMATDGPAIQNAVNQVFTTIEAETSRLSN